MTTIIDLQTALLDLLKELHDTEIRLIIGGGYGIYLKTKYVRTLDVPTLLNEWPEARSTSDLDLFLRPELLIHSEKLRPLSAALTRLGYEPVPGAEKYQFVKPGLRGNVAGGIKIDLLTGPQSRFQGTQVKTDERRAQPKPSVGVHAHPVNETPTLESGLTAMKLGGTLSSGAPYNDAVFLPHPYTFLMMKLFAFRDRYEDANKEYGRYHALDMYTIMATMVGKEFDTALELRNQHKDDSFVIEAGSLVTEYFSSLNKMGLIRLRESPYYRSELQLGDFISTLRELFP